MNEEPEKTEANPAPENEAPAPDAETAADPLAQAQAEAADLRDKLLRTMAEMENYRRRAEKERSDTAKFAIANFARDTLAVLDNLNRGLQTVSAEDRKKDAVLDALASGMELTEREMLATLERHGIVKIDPVDEPFDHNFHQAMLEVEDASKPAGTVAQVMQAGYLLNDRLLRPAMVAVAKGGPKAGDAPKPAPVQAPIANEDLANSDPGDAPEGDPENGR
jgi:molecular chaperone GrpE